jgi:hypothetical protein
MTSRTREQNSHGGSACQKHTTAAQLCFPVYDISESISDVIGTNFHTAASRGEVLVNPCVHVKSTTLRQGGGSYKAYLLPAHTLKYSTTGSGSLTSYYRAYGYDPGLLDIAPSGDETPIAQAKQKALSNVDKAPYSVAEDIATFRETLAFLQNPFNSMRNVLHAFRTARKKLTGIRRIDRAYNSRLKSLASLLLEYRFAMLPSVRTVSTVLQSLADKGNTDYTKVHRAHGSSQPFKAHEKGEAVDTPFTFFRSVKTEGIGRATVYYTVNPPLREWQRKYGLRIKDVPELMWDIFPLSFMYDRVGDIGAAIRGITNLSDPNVKIVGGSVSYMSIKTQTISLIKQTNPSYDVVIIPDVDTFVTEAYTREAWQPSVIDTAPVFYPKGLIRDATSMAELCSLIIQRMR